jgi:hypothetical protein
MKDETHTWISYANENLDVAGLPLITVTQCLS